MDLNYIIRTKKFRTKKSLGQNFLVDSNIIDFIVQNVDSEDEILEIGPGIGFVTEKLVKTAKKVVGVEVDNDAIVELKKNLSNYNNFYLFEQDILKTDIKDLPFNNKKIKVIANIPYYITSPILVHLLGEMDELTHKNREFIEEIILMVQLEVAKRICANERSKNKEYGQLSILCQMFCDCEIIKIVPKTCFSPIPKVDSALVKFRINKNPKVKVTRLFKKTVSALFNQRRKNIKNSLQNAGFLEVEGVLEKIGFDKNKRGENLSIEEIQKLSLALEEYN